jgi:hypothetical protein
MSIYGTWAFAHGQVACLYPPSQSTAPLGTIAPLYLLLSAGAVAFSGIGHSVAFPSPAALGPGCSRAEPVLSRWSAHAGALQPTLWIGCIGWVALMIGVVVWLRASGRGRCGWEPATLVVLACLPQVLACVHSYFHPQDLLAMGLTLAATACACRGRWIGAGILIALALLSQQFALLVAAPLLVLAPRERRVSYVGAAATTWVLVVLAIVAMTGRSSLSAVTLGSGDSTGGGDTLLLHEWHLTGAAQVVLVRVAPLVVALAVTWWASRRLGPAALHPGTLMSIVALSLSLRLVFEKNIFDYYFMALAVALLLLDVARGRVRNVLVAWLTAVTIVFCFLYGFVEVPTLEEYASFVKPVLFLVPVILLMLIRGPEARGPRVLLPWLGVATCAFLTWPGNDLPFGLQSAPWFWDLILVVPAVVLAAAPLLAEVRKRPGTLPPSRIETASLSSSGA